MTHEWYTGLLVLHGNRSELLAEAVFEWVARQPLGPLEQEVFLVQSNGVAEWLKMALASQQGIFAAARVELPGRFLWRAYRQVLGQDAVPAESALDKLPLTWRLMHLLPELVDQPVYAPLAGFLRLGGMARRLQLAQRLADLFDQYQVYRSDWLAAWADGRDTLPRTDAEPAAGSPPLPADQRWQAALWRELLAPLSESDRATTRPQLHRRFVAALNAGATPASPLPRRLVVFGMTHLPMSTLVALAALSAHCQVVLAVPNPCRYHWADILPGRELLRQQRRRHPLRGGRDLAALSLDLMHAHAHPLLAAWGRQGRDFVRQLDAFDDVLAAQQRFQVAKVDLFDDGPGETLLQQVQARIRDLVPLTEHAELVTGQTDPADRSIVFHIAHGAQREVEILHDQLLALLADPPGATPLQPRDIVVMVPEIASFAPAIRSVFGQYARSDARHIPFDITDLPERGNNPVLAALEWLLRLPEQRCGLSEIRDLLEVPALAARFGLAAPDLPRLALWMAGAGIHWGLDADQRAGLGLAACGEQNTWLFGLRRLLLGYAVGDVDGGGDGDGDLAPVPDAIEPYAEVGGLDAALVGALAALVDALAQWAALATLPATPAQWAERGRVLLDALLAPTDERERLTVDALHDGLRAWLAACETAGFDAPVPLAVAREAWLGGLAEPGLNKRFRAGGVTFCTLMPMRAIPFEIVCLLGMNDGDYPRRSPRSDFDLMGLPGQARPGDRSRRDDDRQLMLEALLSARRLLYVSWAGRSARDNSAQPPSVLVSQLRDYLAAGWGDAVLAPRTTEHPLQPFSRRYFEQAALPAAGERLFTHAREWRAAHADVQPDPAARPPALPGAGEAATRLTVDALARFLKNPVRDFFRQRLLVVFGDDLEADQDDEAFGLDGLSAHGLLQSLIDDGLAALQAGAARPDDPAVRVARLTHQVGRLQRAGRLPMAEPGRRAGQWLLETGVQMFGCWAELQALYPLAAPREPLRLGAAGLELDDWLDGLRAAPGSDMPRVWLALSASRLCDRPGTDPTKRSVQPDKLIAAWVRSLAASACGVPARGVIVGQDASVTVEPLPTDEAQSALQALMAAWRDGMTAPLPLAARSGLALAGGVVDPSPIYEGRSFGGGRGEGDEPCLARQFPDYAALSADGRFAQLAQVLYGPLVAWTASQVSFKLHAAPDLAEMAGNARPTAGAPA